MIIIKHGQGRYELRSRRGKERLIFIRWGIDHQEVWDPLEGVSICRWTPGADLSGDDDDIDYLCNSAYGSTRLARRLWRILAPRIGHEIDPSMKREEP